MYRIYRTIIDIPGRPERRGEVVRIEDVTHDALYGSNGRLVMALDGLPSLNYVTEGCASMRQFLAKHGVACKHTIAVLRGTTVEYIEV